MFDGKVGGSKRVVSHAGKGSKANFVSASDAKKLREQREKERKRNAGRHIAIYSVERVYACLYSFHALSCYQDSSCFSIYLL